jgi:hypothetical protein
MIDTEKIIADTVAAFKSSLYRFKNLSTVSEEEYKQLHTLPLTPLSIKIDCDLFLKEIPTFSNYFYQWGTQHTELPRYGLALVNHDGILRSNDPVNGSLYEWNINHPNRSLIETDFLTPTAVMTMQSLKPLAVFNKYWCRSNILRWGKSAMFAPHIDTIIPSPWLRLWAATNEDIVVNFYVDGKIITPTIEPGRLYLIDTSLVHDAVSHNEVYQLFLSVKPEAINILKTLV